MEPSDSVINPEKFDELVRIQRLFGSVTGEIDYPLLKALEKMMKSEYPCALITLEGTRQLWINEKQLEQGLEVNVEEGIGRDTSSFWLPETLQEIVDRVKICGSEGFDCKAPSIIYPPQWGMFDLHFERVESIVGVFRLTVNRDVNPIPPPAIAAS